MTGSTKKPVAKPVDLSGFTLHNGDLRPDLQFKDPISGDLVGGQEAAMRQAMRVKNCVDPWARRQGKSTMREALILNEASLTSGIYYFGLLLPDHAAAFKIFESFRKDLGAFVKDSKGDDKSQDRWIELHAIHHPAGPPPPWFNKTLAARWEATRKTPNTGSRLYFWSAKHPHYESIQGFMHPFHRVDVDEAQQVHPGAYAIVDPMLADVGGHMMVTGTPWHEGIGNTRFEEYWDTSQEPDAVHWFGMRIPFNTNPHVQRLDIEELRRKLSEREIQQLHFAKFLSDAGAVFENLDRVFVLKWIPQDDPSCDWARDIRQKNALPSMQFWIHENQTPEGHHALLSVDWAKSPKGDWSVVTVIDASTGKQLALFRWRGENLVEQMEAVLQIQQHYKAQQAHADANGMGEAMADFMRRRHAVGFVGHKFGRNKVDYVTRGRVLFLDADVSLIACPEQRKEFKDFSVFEKEGLGSDKKLEYCAPIGRHDDMVAAFLQLAPTLTISGRQDAVAPPPPLEPLVNPDDKKTTLALWTRGGPTPFRDRGDDTISWSDIVVPRRLR